MVSIHRARAHVAVVVLALVVIALAVWRAELVRSGPDADSDAYGHHMIARQILTDPTDLGVHWVWLPLFHYLQVPLVAMGAQMNTIRFVNVALWACVPIVLFLHLRRNTARDASDAEARVREWTAFAAALLCALSPIGMQMGTTAQPEPLFCLCVLSFVIAMERARHVRAAILLGAAVMLRYEAWPIIPVVAFLNLGKDARRLWKRWLIVAVPVLLIFAWAVARRPYDGRWFGFLGATRSFANDAMGTKSSFDGGLGMLAGDLLFYAVKVPWRVMGPALILVPIGFVRAARKRGALFMLAYLACLAFLTFTWVMRSSLGLDRHFVVLVPFYCALAAYGLAEIAELGARVCAFPFAKQATSGLAVAMLSVAVATTWVKLDDWMHEWRGALENGWPDRVAMGAFLRTLPAKDVIFCDEATVEILSGLDRRRFDRHWIDDGNELPRVEEAVARDGEAYVATWMKKLGGELGAAGVIVYRPPGETASDAGLGVLKVTATAR